MPNLVKLLQTFAPSFPTSFLISPDGAIATRVDGLVHEVSMAPLIRALLPRQRSAASPAVRE